MSEGPARNQQPISHVHFQEKGVDVRELAVRRLQRYMIVQTTPLALMQDSCRVGGNTVSSRLPPSHEMRLQPAAPTIAFGAMAQKEEQLGMQDDPRIAIVEALRLYLDHEAVPTRYLPAPSEEEDPTQQAMKTLRTLDAMGHDQLCHVVQGGTGKVHSNVQGLPSAPAERAAGRGCPIGARCSHVYSWKRLRGKKGFAYYYCATCFSKWRIPSLNLQLNCGLRLKPARVPLPAFESFSLPSTRLATARLCEQQRGLKQQQHIQLFNPKSWPIQYNSGGSDTLSSNLQGLAWTRA